MARYFFWGQRGLAARPRGAVVTIGNFDGVHLGHRALLEELRRQALRLGEPAVVLLFEPQPGEFFARQGPAPRLMNLRAKVAALRAAGADQIVCLPFCQSLMLMPPEAFVTELLVGALGARHVQVGDDFRFGAGRAGDFPLLEQLGAAHGFGVSRAPTLCWAGERVSSTRIRTLLAGGDLTGAEALLGAPYRLTGRVVTGDRIGRALGFPTANLQLGRQRPPLAGVYAVEVAAVDRGAAGHWQGVANLGTRPTLDGQRFRCEVHLLDFAGDLYGRCLQVTFREHLRPEQRFADRAALAAQIQRDIATARAYFARSAGDRIN